MGAACTVRLATLTGSFVVNVTAGEPADIVFTNSVAYSTEAGHRFHVMADGRRSS